MAPTQAPALPVAIAKKPSHKCTDAFQIVKRAQPGRNDLGYRAASGPRWSDIGGANVGATAFLLEMTTRYLGVCRHPTPIDLKAPAGSVYLTAPDRASTGSSATAPASAFHFS